MVRLVVILRSMVQIRLVGVFFSMEFIFLGELVQRLLKLYQNVNSNSKNLMAGVGFEPTPPKRLVP